MASVRTSPAIAGRKRELATLAEAYTTVTGGAAAAVLIGGEAGVGKSRLVHEFTGTLDALVLTGACVELGADGLPYGPFVAALRTALPSEHAASVGPELAPLLPGVAPGAVAGDDARPRMFESLLGLLAQLTEHGPLVLVLEDAHWADESSRNLIDFLVRNQGATPGLLLVLTYRTDELGRRHPLRRLLAGIDRIPWVHRADLSRLTRREVLDQVRGVLDSEPDPERLEWVFARSAGNPLFVETLLACEGREGLPTSLEDLLLARVELLGPDATQVSRILSVAHGTLEHDVLATLSELSTGAFISAVREAVDGGVLTVEGESYAFRHALIGEAVYGNLLPGERVELHARFADYLCACDAGQQAARRPTVELSGAARHAVEVAHHRYAAGEKASALTAAWDAAGVAARSVAHSERLVMLERVLELWRDVPEAPELTGVGYGEVLDGAAEAASLAGAPARGEELLTVALAELDPERERVKAGILHERRARARADQGRGGVLEDYRAAVAAVPAEHPARAYVLNALAASLFEAGQFADAAEVAEAALCTMAGTDEDPAIASALITLALVDATTNGLEQQRRKLERAKAITRRAGAHRTRLRAIHAEAALLHAFGALAESERVARQGIALAGEVGLARAAGPVHVVDLVVAQFSAGRWDEAVESAAQALELVPPGGYRAHLIAFQGLIALHRGDLPAGQRALDLARALLADDSAAPLDRWMVSRLQVRLLLSQDRLDEATAAVEKALAAPGFAGSRLTWPLLLMSAQVAARAGDVALAGRVREIGDGMTVAGPVQDATERSFVAALGRAEGRDDRAAWDAALAAWEPLEQPLALATALFGAAEAAIAIDGDRGAAGPMLRRAADLADGLGAGPLRDAALDLARRARAGTHGATAEGESRLTARELEILRLVAEGLGNKDIADRLFISAKTASVHVSNILGKLEVTNRVEAAATGRRLGLLAETPVS